MKYVPLDVHEYMPAPMRKYINNYGWHFNKKAYEYATALMYKRNARTDKEEVVQPYTKEEVDALLETHNVKVKTKIMYDYVFAATMCKADFLGDSIPDELHLAKYVKNTVDDPDASEETTFRRWVATTVGNGQPIDWYEIC